MNGFEKEKRILKALSHQTRLAIVARLLDGDECVGGIEDLLHIKQANISQHLSILRWAGVVGFRPEGKTRCYYLKEPEKIRSLFELLRNFTEG